MKTLLARPLPVVLALVFCLSSLFLEGAARRVPKNFFAVNSAGMLYESIANPTNLHNHLRAMTNSGIEMIRLQFDWNHIENTAPTKPIIPALGGTTNHTYYWPFYDAWMGQLATNNINTLGLLLGLPCWTGRPNGCSTPISPPPPTD